MEINNNYMNKLSTINSEINIYNIFIIILLFKTNNNKNIESSLIVSLYLKNHF